MKRNVSFHLMNVCKVESKETQINKLNKTDNTHTKNAIESDKKSRNNQFAWHIASSFSSKVNSPLM